ncbi:MAG: tetratricopeptide repeat protein [Verrucomicrobiae bacterium]|nr:tetratricopeptide repeat protein [Verrucomicrobiae bacterium]
MSANPSSEPPPAAARGSTRSRRGGPASPPHLHPPNWRERVADRMEGRPLIRLLLLNPPFTIVGLLVLGVAVLLLLALPKVWLSTPARFQPAVRVSLLDRVQAWRLERRAEVHLARGEIDEAWRAYAAAVGNDRGDVSRLRRALGVFLESEEGQGGQWALRGGELASWLLRLTGGEDRDVVLGARVFDRLGDYREVIGWLEGLGPALPEEAAALMARARFHLSGEAELADWWLRWERVVRVDPSMSLYRAAWHAGWGSGSEAASGRAQLEVAATTLKDRLLANRLLLRVALQQSDAAGYAQALHRLAGFQGDRFEAYVDYWRLLHRLGRGEEALQLVTDHPCPPRTPAEAAIMGKVLISLGDPSTARGFLERHAPVLGDGPASLCLPLWVLLGNLQAEAGDWPALVRMGKELRTLPRGDTTLQSFGWFVEGRGLAGLGRREEAGRAFDAALDLEFVVPRMTLELAAVWIHSGFPEHASRALRPLEAALAGDIRYWTVLFQATYALRQDESLLFKAARRALDLDPMAPRGRMDYAAALWVNRERSEETVEIASGFLRDNPDTPAARIVLAGALALGGRAEEAGRELLRLPQLADAGLATERALVELEIALANGDRQAMAAALTRIDESFLFPGQRQRLAAARQRFGGASPE